MPCYCISFDKKHIVQTTQKHSFYIWNYMSVFFDTVSGDLFKYQEHIKPALIFNNEDMFETFIHSPFPEMNELEKIYGPNV